VNDLDAESIVIQFHINQDENQVVPLFVNVYVQATASTAFPDDSSNFQYATILSHKAIYIILRTKRVLSKYCLAETTIRQLLYHNLLLL
jgi:hypothetical protein